MAKFDLSDPMSQFHSRKAAKIVTQRELDDKRASSEWDEQLRFCKWLKNTYPDILFRSDIQSAGKLSPGMQNIKQIIDPYSGWPDITVYLQWPLGIEMKRIGASISGEHWRQQSEMHERLRKLGWTVMVCFGAEEAKRMFEEYLHNN